MKTFLSISALSLLVFSFGAAAAPEQILTKTVKRPDGKVHVMDQYKAEKYCLEQGTRLPTVRELAQVSQRMGAKGIRETAYPGVKLNAAIEKEIEQLDKEGFYPVYGLNEGNDKVVDFYFNHQGYKFPGGDLGYHWFWSSTVHPDSSDTAYTLSGRSGRIDTDYRSYISVNAVRCMLKP